MAYYDPVYTEKTECQDCFKCIRHCPVKAVKVEDERAVVMPELCVACGECVTVCPVGAKRVRTDLAQVQLLLRSRKQVFVSLAPSFVSEFGPNRDEQLVNALRQLGFAGVSETALGAEQVSANVAELLHIHREPRLYISSACPVAVEILRKYHPEQGRWVTDLMSPVLAHCSMLRRQYGDDIGIVFIGPCIAKKKEADAHPELLDAVLTFKELRDWLETAGIDPLNGNVGTDDHFVPAPAQEGALYPVDGGMVAGIKANCGVSDAHFMAVSGIDNIVSSLDGLEQVVLDRPVFLEVLACDGGCVNGPLARRRTGTVAKRIQVIARAQYPAGDIPRPVAVDAAMHFQIEPVTRSTYSEADLLAALRLVGKQTPEDELNCGGCGYENCREFAGALLDRKAEHTMCVSYMRKLAQNKANALIRTMPSGVVIVDDTLHVVECNQKFARLLGDEVLAVYETRPGLGGAELAKLVPFANLFAHVLHESDEVLVRDIRYRGRILHVSIFRIEPRRLAGAVIQDITEPSVRKEQVIDKAREVIRNNLKTVQKIAYLLGENAAESEVVLNTIIESFTPEAPHDTGKGRR